MSRSYNKVATTGYCVSNHKANSKYYKAKRKHNKVIIKREFEKIINDELSDNKLDYHNIKCIIYNKQYRKTRRNEWDEPTDGRYKWFKPNKNKKTVVGDDWIHWSTKDVTKKEYLYNKYKRK